MNVLDLFRLNGKTALVTGGSQGIGLTIGLALGQAGATICYNDLAPERLEEAKKIFDDQGIKCFPLVFDVSKDDEVDKGIAEIENKFGAIDILVNNAGIIQRSPILETNNDDFRSVIEINLVSPFVVSKRVVPKMIAKGGGKIINICSMMSEQGRNTVASYAAAKGGLKMLTKNMCTEWAKHNIQVNGIGPGYIETAKTQDFVKKGHPFNNLIMTRTPAGRWGKAEDLVGAAILLASDAGNFINGHIIYVDGGILANFGYLEGENEIANK